jgi:hypothetical protein
MEKLILSVLLLVSATLYAQECNKSELNENSNSDISYLTEDNGIDIESSLKIDKLKQYNNQLNHFLTESNDIKIQLSTYNNSYETDFNIDEIKKVLKTAISPFSDRYTIYLADSLCHNKKELTNWCHQQQIHKVHREIDPENVYTYLFELDENKDKNKIHETLNEIADKTTYSDSFFFEYILQTAEQMVNFNNLNPLLFTEVSSMDSPDGIAHIKENQKEINRLQLVEKGVVPNDLMLNFNENSSIISAIGIEMARVMSFGRITRSCKDINNTDSCSHIGQILIKDKSLMNQMIGFSIKTEVQKLLDVDETTIQKSKMDNEKTTNELMCYAQIPDVMYAQMSNKKLITQYIVDAKNKGELEAFKLLANSVYNTEKKNGFNPSFDPKDCE